MMCRTMEMDMSRRLHPSDCSLHIWRHAVDSLTGQEIRYCRTCWNAKAANVDRADRSSQDGGFTAPENPGPMVDTGGSEDNDDGK